MSEVILEVKRTQPESAHARWRRVGHSVVWAAALLAVACGGANIVEEPDSELTSTEGVTGELAIYNNSTLNGFWGGAYDTNSENPCSTARYTVGPCSFEAAFKPYGAFQFGKEGGFLTSGYSHLEFTLYPFGHGIGAFAARFQLPTGAYLPNVVLKDSHIVQKLANGFVRVRVPISALNPNNVRVYTIEVQNTTPYNLRPVWLDELKLKPSTTIPPPTNPPPTNPPPPPPSGSNDKFGIKKIYSTAPGGREWYMNANNLADGIFDPRIDVTSGTSITKNSDGSWRVNNGQVRMAVTTPSGQKPWRNVEVTGHYKIVTPGSSSDCIQTYARGDVHNDPTPCRGSAIKGRLHFGGKMGFIKELYHEDNNSGYTNEIAMATGTTTSIVGRWVGFKVVFYNVSGGVKMESYLDNSLNNDWKKVTEYLDSGNWSVSDLTDFNNYGNNCSNKDTGSSPLKRNEIITWAGDWVSFRSDYTAYDFKNLSVREILP